MYPNPLPNSALSRQPKSEPLGFVPLPLWDNTAAFAPATADTSPLEASQRSALSRHRSGLWWQRSHRARPHSGRDRAARRTAARAVHVYPANNRGGAVGRRVVIGTTWPRRRRKSAAARMTPGRRWAQNDVVRSGATKPSPRSRQPRLHRRRHAVYMRPKNASGASEDEIC